MTIIIKKAKHESCQCVLVSSYYRTKYSLLEHAGSYADSTFQGDANAVKTSLSHRIKSHNSPKPNKDRTQPTQLWLPTFLVVTILSSLLNATICLALNANLAFPTTQVHSWCKYWYCKKQNLLPAPARSSVKPVKRSGTSFANWYEVFMRNLEGILPGCL